MKKNELLCALIELGVADTELDGKNKKELEVIYASKTVSPPTITDPGWTQYVLSRLSEDELDDGNPRLEGLRRMTALLVGEVLIEGSELVSPPSHENSMTACAKGYIVVKDKISGDEKRYEALADSSPENTDSEYSKFPCAMADTRAKGRCYRSALKLKRVISAEEAHKMDPSTSGSVDSSAIQTGQKATINLMAGRLNIPVDKLLKELKLENETLDSLTKGEALSVIKHLNELRTKK
mgnify:CR=1 FL=1